MLFCANENICGVAREIFACIYCLICLGPFLIIIGLIVLFSAATSNSRGDETKLYNKSVDAWTSTYRAEFATSMGWTTFLDDNDKATLTADTTTDPLNDDHTSDLHSYVALKYTLPLAAIIPTLTFETDSYDAGLYNQTLTFNSTDSSHSVVSFNLLQILLAQATNAQMNCDVSGTQSDTNSCPNVCQNKYAGVYDSFEGECDVLQVIKSFCGKVSLVSGQWGPDFTNGGYGCGPSLALPSSGTFPVETYTNVAPPNDGDIVDFGGVTVTLRSAHDPYIAAAQITGGSLDFGLTKAQKAGAGLIIIIIGAVFMAPAILIVVGVVYWSKNRNNR